MAHIIQFRALTDDGAIDQEIEDRERIKELADLAERDINDLEVERIMRGEVE